MSAPLRRLAAGLAVTLATALMVAVPVRAAPPATYYALVFNAPAPGREAEYNRWYDTQHAPDVVSIPGFVTAQRYKRAAAQLRADAGDSPPYLIVYRIVTDDLAAVFAEVNRRAADGRTRMNRAVISREGGMNITYRITDTRRWPQPGKGSPPYLHVVLSDAKPGEEPAYDRWYAEHHGPDVTSVPGFTGYTLGVFAADQMIPDDHAQHHLALFDIQSRDLAATMETFRLQAPHHTPGPGFVNLWGYTYQAIGPELSGNRIRAHRARLAHARRPGAGAAPDRDR